MNMLSGILAQHQAFMQTLQFVIELQPVLAEDAPEAVV
jgi:hypothetical protein